MRKNDEGGELYAVIRDIYNSHRDQPSVNPIWLANEAMQAIRFEREMHDLGWIGCNLQFRQIARSFCRGNFDPVERAESCAGADLFPDTLQERYPLRPKAGEEAEYVLLGSLPDTDATYNIDRMRRASLALQRHSDALEAFVRARRGAVPLADNAA